MIGAPQAWQATGTTGTGTTIGVIDTGVDYTHADFGGPGTAQDYTDALAADTQTPDYPDPDKVSGGYDFAGDDYDATQGSGHQTPVPDDNPLDCNGHGSHVAGTAAGLGVDNDGDTYTGPYDTSIAGGAFRIRPGVAPGATIVPLKIFGCDQNATTDLVSQALDWAADPNGDGDPADHLDVVNLSLGSDYTSPQDPDAVAAGNAAELGIVVVAAAGNGGDVYDAGGSPGNAPDVLSVAAADSTDTIASFSSRGVRGAGNTKPDITAPGVAITSVAFGTGSFGIGEEGTSMATPHVSGSAALVRQRYPAWTVDQVKAALMDTASGGVKATSTLVAPPMRAGSGLVQVNQALSTSILAYSADDPAAVSLSFGTVPVTTSTLTVTRTITVQSLRNINTSYTTAFQAASLPAGVSITLAGSVIGLPPGASVSLPVTLTIDPTKLKLTADPTKTMTGSGLDDWIAEASGWVVLTPRDGKGVPLRVSVYAAPRRASTMAAASSATVTASTIGTGTLALSGNGFGSGASSASGTYASLLTATQLQATSPQLPACSGSVLTGCVPFSDDRAADIRYVGTSSDAPYCDHGGHPVQTCVGNRGITFDALVNVAVTTWGAWRTPSSFAQFYVYWDINGDGIPDAMTLNTRLSDNCPAGSLTTLCDTDQLVAQTYLPCDGSDPSQCIEVDGSSWQDSAQDRQPLNTIGGELDTSPFDSDALVLPVALSSLVRAGWNSATTPHLHYWVTSSTVENAGVDLDSVASSAAPLTVTAASPALGAVGDLGLPELNSDKAGSAFALKVRMNSAALLFDLPAGSTPSLLLIHHDNLTGARAQIVPVKRAAAASVVLSPTSAGTTTHVRATVTVSPSAATGTVTCRDGSKVLVTATLSAGKAVCTLPLLAKGTHSINAVYSGNVSYAPVTSAGVTLKIS
jgi:subtilisin family serine protease